MFFFITFYLCCLKNSHKSAYSLTAYSLNTKAIHSDIFLYPIICFNLQPAHFFKSQKIINCRTTCFSLHYSLPALTFLHSHIPQPISQIPNCSVHAHIWQTVDLSRTLAAPCLRGPRWSVSSRWRMCLAAPRDFPRLVTLINYLQLITQVNSPRVWNETSHLTRNSHALHMKICMAPTSTRACADGDKLKQKIWIIVWRNITNGGRDQWSVCLEGKKKVPSPSFRSFTKGNLFLKNSICSVVVVTQHITKTLNVVAVIILIWRPFVFEQAP